MIVTKEHIYFSQIWETKWKPLIYFLFPKKKKKPKLKMASQPNINIVFSFFNNLAQSS